MKILTIKSGSKFLHLLFTGIFLCLFIIQSSGQKRDFKEAQIYVTAQATHQLLANQGFKAFEPLEQPNENYPTIMIDVHNHDCRIVFIRLFKWFECLETLISQ